MRHALTEAVRLYCLVGLLYLVNLRKTVELLENVAHPVSSKREIRGPAQRCQQLRPWRVRVVQPWIMMAAMTTPLFILRGEERRLGVRSDLLVASGEPMHGA